jgi:DNA-binding response OmpR family regulator
MSTVLIVEDEPGLRAGLVAAVQSLGSRALSASGLAAARQLLRSESVDCVLLDIRLRDGDGLSLLTELQEGPHRDVPVIVATAYGDGERKQRALGEGAFEYLIKPFDFPLLLGTLKRALQQRAPRSRPPAEPPPRSPTPPEGLTLREAVARLERQMIGRTLVRAAGSREELTPSPGGGPVGLVSWTKEPGSPGEPRAEREPPLVAPQQGSQQSTLSEPGSGSRTEGERK